MKSVGCFLLSCFTLRGGGGGGSVTLSLCFDLYASTLNKVPHY